MLTNFIILELKLIIICQMILHYHMVEKIRTENNIEFFFKIISTIDVNFLLKGQKS